MDNPQAIEKEIEKLGQKEHYYFTKGYLLALLNIQEHLTDLKAEFYQALLNGDHDERLQSILKVLEAMDSHYAARVNNLELEIQTTRI